MSTGSRPLEILGITENEEQVYGWILTHPGCTAEEISEALNLTIGKTRGVLDTIQAKGLVTQSPEQTRRHIPVSPDIAMEALALQRQNDLKRARHQIQKLQVQASLAYTETHQQHMVELITSREVERNVYEQLDRGAKEEVLTLVRPPILISNLNANFDEDQKSQRDAQRRGVRYRSIIDSNYLSMEGALPRTQRDIDAGETVRIVPTLPFKMTMVDHRTALLPMDLEHTESPCLLVRSSALLNALYALFELLWNQSTPVTLGQSGDLKIIPATDGLSRKAEDLIPHLITGMNDKSIAGAAEISMRTLRRRIGELMNHLGARSRFQAGWLAALRATKNAEN